MLTAEALADLISKYNPKSNSAKIVEAYKYGQTKHEGQFRKSGEPYFTHPVSVAEMLAPISPIIVHTLPKTPASLLIVISIPVG